MTLAPSLPIPSIRALLRVDIVTCSLASALMILAAGPLADATDLPASLLRGAGLALIPFVAFLAWLVTNRPGSRPGLTAVVIANVLWAGASIFVLFHNEVEANAAGVAFVLAQAAAVFVLALGQFARLRTMA